ncbi:MAG: DUF1638 domain-containing protein [Eubacteriaceae bacterium]|nr:DUF1638 domain-containing protein [Eubacteriaceae bacterium]
MNITAIACGLLKGDLMAIVEEAALAPNTIWLEPGLHKTPDKLRGALQDTIDSLDSCDEIILGYSLCGNALLGLRASSARIRYLATDDCISAVMHTNPKLGDLRRTSLFTSKSWLSELNPEEESINNAYEKYGNRADRIIALMYKNYKSVVYMQTSSYIEDEWAEKAELFAKRINKELIYEPGDYSAYEALFNRQDHELVKVLEKGETITLRDFFEPASSS